MVAINKCRQPSTTHFVDVYEVMVDRTTIPKNGVYTYQGHRYKVLDFVTDIPSFQHKVLVERLTGPDAGEKFTCTLDHFDRRYSLESAGDA